LCSAHAEENARGKARTASSSELVCAPAKLLANRTSIEGANLIA
jgi:hypothetical protein